MTIAALALTIAADVLAQTPVIHLNGDSATSCVDANAVTEAIDAVGGIDPAEHVRISLTQVDDKSYELGLDIALIGAARLERTTPLRAVECADVPELVAVLLMSMRREAAEATKTVKAAAIVIDKPVRNAWRPAPRLREAEVLDAGWSPCHGPPSAGPLSLNGGIGIATTGPRAQLDAGYDINDRLTITLESDMSSFGGGVHAGVAWRTHIEGGEVSVRGLLGGGLGLPLTLQHGPFGVGYTNNPAGFVAPIVAARGRIGWVFGELGATWRFGSDVLPGAYATIGVALLAPQSR